MNLKDIAVFKKFIAHKDLRRAFIRCYNASKGWAKLPTSIEDYLSNVDPMAVITKAVRVCRPNATYGYDFWQDINEDWKMNYKKLQSSHFYQESTDAESLTGYYNVLRENWDDYEKPWRHEEMSVARKRLGLSEPETVEETNVSSKDNETAPPLIDFSDNTDELEIDFIDIDKKKYSSNTLKQGVISINTRSHSYKVSINKTDAKDIKKKQANFARVGKIKTGDVVIQFDNVYQGVPINYTSDGYYNVNNRQLVENLIRLLSLPNDLSYCCIEKIAEKLDSITYKITKQ